MNRLLRIGFIPVGNWKINDNLSVYYNLNSNHNTRNILYTFICNGEILYIGKTTRTLNSRMYGYQNPGPTQSTNIRVNKLLKETILKDLAIDIFILVDNGLLKYGDFKINIAAGLEDTLIFELIPKWNYSGKRKIIEDKESEEIDKTKSPIPEIKSEIKEINNFTIILGSTYFKQGFFNVPIEYSNDFAADKSKIEILLGNTTNSIPGYINRQANKILAPRIMGGVELKKWIQSNFKQGDALIVRIISQSSILLEK